MLTAAGGLIIAIMFVIAIPISVAIMCYDPKQYKKLVDLETQRRYIVLQLEEEKSKASWITRWRFKNYLNGGGN